VNPLASEPAGGASAAPRRGSTVRERLAPRLSHIATPLRTTALMRQVGKAGFETPDLSVPKAVEPDEGKPHLTESAGERTATGEPDGAARDGRAMGGRPLIPERQVSRLGAFAAPSCLLPIPSAKAGWELVTQSGLLRSVGESAVAVIPEVVQVVV